MLCRLFQKNISRKKASACQTCFIQVRRDVDLGPNVCNTYSHQQKTISCANSIWQQNTPFFWLFLSCNQYWAGRVYGFMCVFLCRKHPKIQPAVVLIWNVPETGPWLKSSSVCMGYAMYKLVTNTVSFCGCSLAVTSTGPGGFKVLCFVLCREHPKVQPTVVLV